MRGLRALLAASKQTASPELADEEVLSASHASIDLDRRRQAGLAASKQLGPQNLLGGQHARVCLQLRGHCLERSRAKGHACCATSSLPYKHAAMRQMRSARMWCGAQAVRGGNMLLPPQADMPARQKQC